MEQKNLMTVEYYDATDPDRLIGAVYVPGGSAQACVRQIGHALLRALGGNCLTARLLDANGDPRDEMTVFRNR